MSISHTAIEPVTGHTGNERPATITPFRTKMKSP